MSDARRVTVEYQLLRAILNDDQMIVVCDNPNGHHALIPWEEFAAKDAVVEAARVTHENYRRRFGPKAAEVDMGKLWSALDALDDD